MFCLALQAISAAILLWKNFQFCRKKAPATTLKISRPDIKVIPWTLLSTLLTSGYQILVEEGLELMLVPGLECFLNAPGVGSGGPLMY